MTVSFELCLWRPLIRFQCRFSSPGDGGGERERDLMMGLGRCVGEGERERESRELWVLLR